MKFNPKIVFIFTAILAVSSSYVFTQETKVKWQGIIGKDNEFIFLIPEGFQTSDDGEIHLGKASETAVRVKDLRTVSRYINGVVLMVQIYEGKAREIDSALAEMMNIDLIKQQTIHGFEFKSYLKKYPDFTREQQHFFREKSLYVVSASYRNERGIITDNFFKAVRLINQGKAVAPNLAENTPKSVLNASLPSITVEAPVSEEIVENPDKKAVVIYLPKPSFKREFGRGNSGKVIANALFSASGKVNKVELVGSPNLSVFEGVKPSVEHTIFIPAEKNGKPVTTWHKVEYGFQMTLQGH